MPDFTGQYAGILLASKEGDIILQQRDNKPEIINPGKITTFGGLIEKGESPRQAAVRELKEETSLNINANDLEVFNIYNKTKEDFGKDQIYNIFLLRGVKQEALIIKEGAGYMSVGNQNQLDSYNLSVLAREILDDYFNRKRGESC